MARKSKRWARFPRNGTIEERWAASEQRRERLEDIYLSSDLRRRLDRMAQADGCTSSCLLEQIMIWYFFGMGYLTGARSEPLLPSPQPSDGHAIRCRWTLHPVYIDRIHTLATDHRLSRSQAVRGVLRLFFDRFEATPPYFTSGRSLIMATTDPKNKE